MELPKGSKLIKYKWAFKIEKDPKDNIKYFNVRLVA